MLFQGPTQEFTVVGTVGYGDGDQGPRRHHVGVLRHRRPRRRCSARPGKFDTIDVSAEEGVTQAELAERLSAVVPEGTEAVTGATVAKENADAIKENFKIVGHHLRDLRRHRAVRRLLHHLEHVHDDRHPAVA